MWYRYMVAVNLTPTAVLSPLCDAVGPIFPPAREREYLPGRCPFTATSQTETGAVYRPSPFLLLCPLLSLACASVCRRRAPSCPVNIRDDNSNTTRHSVS